MTAFARVGALVLVLVLVTGLGGCTAAPVLVTVDPPPASDFLFRPARLEPGRLAYAPDRTTFAPVLTERRAYPTQVQANDAYRRFLAGAPPDLQATSVRLFACKPGVLDGQTARVVAAPGERVHCATDVLGPDARPLGRLTVNFTYADRAWIFEPVDAPRSRASWIGRERSPRDPWWWWPGRDRYE